MPDHNEIWIELQSLLKEYDEQKKQIFLHYQQLVAFVISLEITSKEEIEKIMDGLLDFCDNEEFLKLYKELCRHVYNHHPQLFLEYNNIFRILFEEKETL